jgi:membrane protein DedA with SNARE-associated domain
MNLSDYLLSTLGVYGLPVLFGTLLVGSVGVPTPASLLLLVAGSFVEQGDMKLWQVLLMASAGAILGDQIGYMLGRWGGRRLALRLSRWAGGEERLKSAEAWLRRHGGAGIFFSRWLLTPLGPFVNITSGLTGYPWPRFLLYDIVGEALWVVLYVLLGKFFSDQVEAVSGFFGDFVWLIVGLLFVGVLGWYLFRYFRTLSPSEPTAEASAKLADHAS